MVAASEETETATAATAASTAPVETREAVILHATQPPPPPCLVEGPSHEQGNAAGLRLREFWTIMLKRNAGYANGLLRRCLRGALPSQAADLVADYVFEFAPFCDLGPVMWESIHNGLDHVHKSSVLKHFQDYQRRFTKKACKIYPGFTLGDGEKFRGVDCGQYAQCSPVRFCHKVFFYRLHKPVMHGKLEMRFVADVLGQLTNGLYFYYSEGPAEWNPGCCCCAGVGRCADYRVVVAQSLAGVAKHLRPEERLDIVCGATVPRLQPCSCQLCRAVRWKQQTDKEVDLASLQFESCGLGSIA